jgi:hypothetical protein
MNGQRRERTFEPDSEKQNGTPYRPGGHDDNDARLEEAAIDGIPQFVY